MDSTEIARDEFLDILFYGRNKDYGAYELRSRYNKRVRNAIMGTAAVMLILAGGYVVSNRLLAAADPHPPVFAKDAIKLDEVKLPEADPVIPPPPPKTPSAPPPAAAAIDFATMVITDKPVDPDEMPPRHDDIGNKAIGFENTEGAEDGLDPALDPRNSGNGVVAPPPAAPDANGPVTFVEINPEFPGGEAALAKYLGKSLRYPHLAQENNIEGTVSIRFVVNRDGRISDVEVVGAPKGGGLEEEAMRVVRNMPRWKPGRQNGQNVAVFFNLPVRFLLNR